MTGTWSPSSGGGTQPSHGIQMNTAGPQPSRVVSDSFSLSLSGLPAHSMVFVEAGIELYNGGDVGTSTTVEYGGTTQTYTTEAPGDISFSGPSGWVAASGTSMTITVTAHDYADGYTTDLQDVTVFVYNPTVTVGGGGSVSEDSDTPLTFTVSRDTPEGYAGVSEGDEAIPSTTVSLDVGGTATQGSDYTGNPTSATIPSTDDPAEAANSATVSVTPVWDTVDPEPDETVVLTPTGGAGYTAGNGGTGTIRNVKHTDITPAQVGQIGSTAANRLATPKGQKTTTQVSATHAGHAINLTCTVQNAGGGGPVQGITASAQMNANNQDWTVTVDVANNAIAGNYEVKVTDNRDPQAKPLYIYITI